MAGEGQYLVSCLGFWTQLLPFQRVLVTSHVRHVLERATQWILDAGKDCRVLTCSPLVISVASLNTVEGVLLWLCGQDPPIISMALV